MLIVKNRQYSEVLLVEVNLMGCHFLRERGGCLRGELLKIAGKVRLIKVQVMVCQFGQAESGVEYQSVFDLIEAHDPRQHLG